MQRAVASWSCSSSFTCPFATRPRSPSVSPFADHVRLYADNGVPFVMGTMGGDRDRMRAYVEEKGVYAVLPSAAGEQVRRPLFVL